MLLLSCPVSSDIIEDDLNNQPKKKSDRGTLKHKTLEVRIIMERFMLVRRRISLFECSNIKSCKSLPIIYNLVCFFFFLPRIVFLINLETLIRMHFKALAATKLFVCVCEVCLVVIESFRAQEKFFWISFKLYA